LNSLPFYKGGDKLPNKILPEGYENQVRIDLGVTQSVLSDTDIQSKATLAEALIIRSVPNYQEILEGNDDRKTFLQSAVIAKVCSLLCSGMSQRVKVQQQDETLYAYRIQSIDWKAKKAEFEEMVTGYIGMVLGNELTTHTLLGVVKNDRPKT